jgi:cyclophilin family peptidyl-prolyl cis-trans isomerase
MSAYTGSIQQARRYGVFATIIFAVTASPTLAQQHDHGQPGAAPADHSQHQATKSTRSKKNKAPPKKPKGDEGHGTHATPQHDAQGVAPADHGGHEQHGGMKGFLGPYGMTREGSGTSWVPDVTPHEGIHGRFGEWTTMAHAQFNFVLDRQGGPRGGDMGFVNGMVMAMAQRPLGDGTFGLRAMLSPDPFMGPSGYPLLLASGETADGKTHLIDRQHPHDLFMELAAIYSHNLSANSSFFLYAGLPGEPALGPPAFMHRLSGVDIPEAPITHHWLDSTHITFGVVTAGVVVDNWKLEASAFRGREPDQYRYDIEAPKLDSFSARLTWNPIRELSIQVSAGRLHSPEALDPMVNEDRITASATYAQPFGTDNIWSTTFAWGRKILRPGETLDGYLLESALIVQKTYTVFMRAERVAETELHDDVPVLAGRVLNVNKVSVGGIYDFYRTDHAKVGVGGLVSRYLLPDELKPLYSSDPTSAMVFMRLKVI